MELLTHTTQPERFITGVSQMGNHHWEEFPKGTPVILDRDNNGVLPYLVIRRDKFFHMIWAEFFADLATARKCLMDELPGIRRDEGGSVKLKYAYRDTIVSATWRADGIEVVL